MNVFGVQYWKKGKETGTRKYNLHSLCSDSFESVLFTFTLDHLCESVYYFDYEPYMLNEHLFVKRIRANGIICEYEVTLLHWRDRNRIVANYIVQMECLENDGSTNILAEKQELKPLRLISPDKPKLPTEWYKNETRAVRWFLMFLNLEGSLEALKKADYMSKPTFYRNLKVCEDKGYIKDGKLVRRLFVAKNNK